MKSKLLIKLRKEAIKQIYVEQVFNDWDFSSIYKVHFSKNRSRQYQTSACAYKFAEKKRREYILKKLHYIKNRAISIIK